jgi:S1-C subfamily serine protease
MMVSMERMLLPRICRSNGLIPSRSHRILLRSLLILLRLAPHKGHGVRMWSKLLCLALALSTAHGAEKIQSISFPGQAVGIIVGTNGSIVGSGFIVGSPQRVITCDHVVRSQPAFNFTYMTTSGQNIAATIETLLPRYDLAVLRLEGTNQMAVLPYGDIRRIRPGDQLVYAGFNSKTNAVMVSLATVSAIGVAENEGVSVDFLEFEGEGIPGYSGGPVFNGKGEVVALMREAWTKRGVKGGKEILVNRAFAIEPAMLSKEIFYPSIATPPATNSGGTNTITIKLETK